MTKNYILNTPDNQNIRITTFNTETNKLSRCLIFVHGFKGFKDWGFIPYIGNYFANRDFYVITFNFSYNGIGENLKEFTEMEKFADNTISREVNELLHIIDACGNNFFGNFDFSKIGIIGHSRGGAVSILAANKSERVDAIAAWSSIAVLDRYTERQKKEWQKKGFTEFLNTRTNQMMRLNLALLEDIENNKSGYLNIENAVKKLKKAFLIVHGEQDLTVPVKEAELLYKWSNKEFTEFYKIHSTGHTFDIQHPFTGSNEKFERVLEKTHSFFNKHFN